MIEKQNFYITTPIYYWNWLPHVGHFYSSTIANVIHKYNKISGRNSRFTTWIDENSQKSVFKAEELGVSIEEYTEKMAIEHKKVWDYFKFDYTDFVRTTSPRHHTVVSKVLQHCFRKWDIYEWEYEWMYCIWCESFKKDDDLVFLNIEQNKTFPVTDKIKVNDNIIKVCPDHLKTPDTIKEKNYFFTLSKYQTWIEEFYDTNPNFVNPDFRYNEVKAFVWRGLEDFSISRETNTFWIPLPFDRTQVTYVWFDALFNYYTSCKKSRAWDKNNENYIDESGLWERKDIESGKIIHVVWKDIIRFHAIFWPAMLASYFDLWEEKNWVIHFKQSDLNYLPDTILTGWFFTVDGQKMSKSIWNVINPVKYSEKYSKELLILYILSSFNIWNDWDYDRKDAILNYNAKLANNFGNLVNRVVVLSLKLPQPNPLLRGERIEWSLDYICNFDKSINEYNLKHSLDLSFEFLDSLNKFADIKEPWQTIKDEDKVEETREVLYTLAEWLRQVWLALYPFFPDKMWEMFSKLGLEGYTENLEAWKLGELRNKKEIFKITEKGEALFARFDLES
jgi:methionyl-tRNA synthetase